MIWSCFFPSSFTMFCFSVQLLASVFYICQFSPAVAVSSFPLLIALHSLLLLSCFLPICMPKVEVCVPSVSMFTFRLCCVFFFPLTCYYLSMPFPNNGTAKRSWRSSYFFKTHRPVRKNLGVERKL